MPKTSLSFNQLLGLLLFAIAWPASAKADAATFDAGQTVEVRLNWQSFVDLGFSADWQSEVERSIQHAIDRWHQVSGVNVKLVYKGKTTRCGYDPNAKAKWGAPDWCDPSDYRKNEILIRAHTFKGARLASTFDCQGVGSCQRVLIYRIGADLILPGELQEFPV